MKVAAPNRFAQKLNDHGLPLRHTRTEVLQVNVGKLCNLTCIHCYVNAGPNRKEIMTRADSCSPNASPLLNVAPNLFLSVVVLCDQAGQ